MLLDVGKSFENKCTQSLTLSLSLSHSHTHTLSLSLSLSHSLSLSLSHAFVQLNTRKFSLSPYLISNFSFTSCLSPSISLSHIHSLWASSLSRSHAHIVSHSLWGILFLSLSHTHKLFLGYEDTMSKTHSSGLTLFSQLTRKQFFFSLSLYRTNNNIIHKATRGKERERGTVN